MLNKIRPGVILGLSSGLTLVTCGVAAAVPITQTKVTANDYRLTLSMDDVNIQSVPNMAAAPLVREGFITATVRLKAECVRKEQPCDTQGVTPAVTSWAQVGCSTQMGEDGIVLSPAATLQSGLPTSLGGFLPQGSDVTNIGITPTAQGVGPGPLSVVIKPGYISDVRIGSKASDFGSMSEKKEPPKEKAMSVSVTNRHLVVDQTKADDHAYTCVGPVTIRIRAQGVLRTPTSVDAIDIFGDLYTL